MAKKSGNILIVDDNENVLKSMKLILSHHFNHIETIKNPNLIYHLLEQNSYDAILLDMNFSAGINTGNEGLFWLKEILKRDSDAIVIMITAYGEIELSVEAMKLGANDFITKPWDNDKLIATIKTGVKLRDSKKEVKSLKTKQKILVDSEHITKDKLIGFSKIFKEILKTVDKVAKTDANILITGESGTGKELIAREIHRLSKRKNNIFLSLDISTINENLIESELFGYVKGAFTDAKENKTGRMESASGGTLFLDEIGNLNMQIQAKLLTVIQSKEIVPVGSNTPIPIDIRLISATNKNLNDLIQLNLFREDLLYRINTIHIEIPPLRERKEDIPALSEYFLQKFRKKYHKINLKLSEQSIKKMESYHWPGNIRELEHTIEKAVILSETEIIKPDEFYFTIPKNDFNQVNTLNLEEVEKNTIQKALKQCNYNISKTAETLGITRKTLYKKIEKYDL